MVSIDLKDAYLQIPIHPASRKYLRFTAGGKTWQFRALCFGLSTAPQVFTRVMAPVSRIPPSSGSSDASVSGRLADPCVISGGCLPGKGSGSQPLSGAGNCGQPGKVDSYSTSADYVLRNQDRLADFMGFGDSLEDRKVLLNSRRISVLKGAVCEVLEGLAGPPRLSVSSCAEWPASNESFTIGSKSRLGLSGRGGPGSLGSSFSGRRWWCADSLLEEGISLVLHSPDQMFWSDASNLGWGPLLQTSSLLEFGWKSRPLSRSIIASCCP